MSLRVWDKRTCFQALTVLACSVALTASLTAFRAHPSPTVQSPSVTAVQTLQRG